MKARIKVNEVKPGMFTTERYVSFIIAGKEYSLFVDQASVNDHTLEVQLVEDYADQALVELPRDTFAAGSRVFVPKDILVMA